MCISASNILPLLCLAADAQPAAFIISPTNIGASLCVPSTKDTTKKRVIDLTGPDGNAFVLLGIAKGLCKELEIDDTKIIEDMKSGGYENLIETFDAYFGDYVDLER